jgi:undecaprenyl-diphosphatase
MNIIHSIILGLVEGVTEFLPVSSTAHLIITSKILNIAQSDFQKFFEVFIQGGAILAVVVLYFQYILKHRQVLKHVIISFIPTAIVGLGLYKIIKKFFFESTPLIAMALIIVGLVFIVVEYLVKNKKIKLTKNIKDVTIKSAILIGLAQSLAVIPGVSRAGIVIIAMMIFGYEREDAALYSFLLAVPTILAASALDLFKSRELLFTLGGADWTFLIVGLIISTITAYLSVKWLIGYIKKHSLIPFGIYRIALGIIVLLGII